MNEPTATATRRDETQRVDGAEPPATSGHEEVPATAGMGSSTGSRDEDSSRGEEAGGEEEPIVLAGAEAAARALDTSEVRLEVMPGGAHEGQPQSEASVHFEVVEETTRAAPSADQLDGAEAAEPDEAVEHAGAVAGTGESPAGPGVGEGGPEETNEAVAAAAPAGRDTLAAEVAPLVETEGGARPTVAEAPRVEEEALVIDPVEELMPCLEAALFCTPAPLRQGELCELLGARAGPLRKALKSLAARYDECGSALEVVKTPKGYTLGVRPRYREVAVPLLPLELSDAALKTLTLIALKQPLSQSDLVQMRGSTTYDHVRELVKSGLIRRRRDGPTYTLRTTREFAARFGVENDPVAIRDVLAAAEDRARRAREKSEDTTPTPPPTPPV